MQWPGLQPEPRRTAAGVLLWHDDARRSPRRDSVAAVRAGHLGAGVHHRHAGDEGGHVAVLPGGIRPQGRPLPRRPRGAHLRIPREARPQPRRRRGASLGGRLRKADARVRIGGGVRGRALAGLRERVHLALGGESQVRPEHGLRGGDAPALRRRPRQRLRTDLQRRDLRGAHARGGARRRRPGEVAGASTVGGADGRGLAALRPGGQRHPRGGAPRRPARG
mmetsp:Transcript_59812/g.165443  ORF Transcript_59812/g.165443 Transcript_59812/m.165443 type:complete len:222 (+) Transcript_59812:360-1025(+)